MIEMDLIGSLTMNNLFVLVAEDDATSMFYLKTLLSHAKCKIFLAGNGKEAVEQCYQYPQINLVLMDIRMPVMDGMEATRKIKAFRKDLTVIAITAYALKGDEARVREAGCDDYLPKPVSKKVLFDKINEHLRDRTLLAN